MEKTRLKMAIADTVTWEAYILQVEKNEGLDEPLKENLEQVIAYFTKMGFAKPKKMTVPYDQLAKQGEAWPASMVAVAMLDRVCSDLDAKAMVKQKKKKSACSLSFTDKRGNNNLKQWRERQRKSNGLVRKRDERSDGIDGQRHQRPIICQVHESRRRP